MKVERITARIPFVGNLTIGHKYTLNIHEIRLINPTNKVLWEDPSVREISMDLPDSGLVIFTEYFGIIYAEAAKKIRDQVVSHGFEFIEINPEK